ncbi:MAG: hypothetical protein AMXMBFR64_25210 [Myxococcales bacterium]
MQGLSQNRFACIGLSVAVAAGLIGVLSAAVTPGEWVGLLLLDRNVPELQVFPYPFTIQNLMTLLFAAGVGDIVYRRGAAAVEGVASTARILPEDDRTVLVGSDLGPIRRSALEGAQTRGSFLAQIVDQCVLCFHANQATDQTHQILTSLVDHELHRVDLRYTLLRYLAWLIPTMGFIGTVVGIAGALSVIQGAGEDLSSKTGEITASLSTAFYSTILALCQSAILVLLTQFTQTSEEEAINRSSDYCLRNLVNRLYVPQAVK